MSAGLGLGLALSGACAVGSSFLCEADSQCRDGDALGFCEVEQGICSFEDLDCPSMRRYGTLGGELAGECVPETTDNATTGDPTQTGSSTSGNPDPTVASTSPTTTNPTTTGTDSTTNQASAGGGSTGDTFSGTQGSAGGGSSGSEFVTQVMTFGEGSGTDVSGVTRDSFLDGGEQGRNNGTHADFHIVEQGGSVGLLRFDVSALPSDSIIVDVELDLHTGGSPDIDCLVEFFAVREEWDEGTSDNSAGISNWTQRTSSDSWTEAGCGPGSYDSMVLGSVDQPRADTGYTVELDPSAVQAWIDDPGENYGLLAVNRNGSSCYGWFMSSNAGPEAERPLLRVEYGVP